jgi:flagellar biogenesis protein FliO
MCGLAKYMVLTTTAVVRRGVLFILCGIVAVTASGETQGQSPGAVNDSPVVEEASVQPPEDTVSSAEVQEAIDAAAAGIQAVEKPGASSKAYSEQDKVKTNAIGQALDAIAQKRDAPVRREEPEVQARESLAGPALKMFCALLFVLAVFLFGVAGLRRLRKRSRFLSGLFPGTDLAKVIGKLSLSPRASLHFVKVGGRVLAVGVTANDVRLVTEFDASVFERHEPEKTSGTSPDEDNGRFGAELAARAAGFSEVEDGEFDPSVFNELRSEIQRLQRYLRESADETKE